jgi:hypothetical protein
MEGGKALVENFRVVLGRNDDAELRQLTAPRSAMDPNAGPGT